MFTDYFLFNVILVKSVKGSIHYIRKECNDKFLIYGIKIKIYTHFVLLKYYRSFYIHLYIYIDFYCYEKIIADRNWIVSKK